MKKREYHIKVYSIGRFIISMLIIFLSSIFFIIEKLPKTDIEFISILQFVVVFAASFYLASLVGMGKIKVVLNEYGILHIWERRFILSCEKSFKIPWNIVDNFVFQEDRTFDSFIINLTNKRRYKINKLNLFPIKDNFKKLVKDFPKVSNNLKNCNYSDIDEKSINEGETIYESKSFRWAFYFMSALFLILLITKIINHDSKTTWGTLGFLGTALLFYGQMIRIKKKNN